MPLRLALVCLALVGAGVLVYAFDARRAANDLQRAFASDPVCTRTLTLRTPPRTGTVCSIVAGRVEEAVAVDAGTKSSIVEDHIVVAVPGAARTDVRIFDDSNSYLTDAKAGSPVVLETMRGVPALIATADGARTAQGDPELQDENVRLGSAIGATLIVAPLVILLVLRLFRAGRSSRPSLPFPS